MRMTVSLTLFALALAPACSRELGPEAAYRALAKAVAERDADRAWSLLSRSSQERLDRKAQEAAARAPGVVPGSGRQLLLGDAAFLSRPASAVSVVSRSGDRALLRVDVEGSAPREVTLVREGSWRVEIP
jgi:hypothetical protein